MLSAQPSMDFSDLDASEIQLPTPTDTPYRTPLHRSRGPSRNITPSPGPSPYSNASSSPHSHDEPPSPLADPRLSHVREMGFDHQDPISVFDPRRFTPTLHANLVAEILNLRRELESKTSLIDSLENDLSAARSENENVVETAASAQREARNVKRQLARAENDVTLEEISRERDEAVESANELRKQLERVARARRSAEEDLERFRKAQERDVERWEEVRRGLERRAHVAESRLKSVLEEIAEVNAMQQIREEEETVGELPKRTSKRFSWEESGKDSDNTSMAASSPRKGGFRPTSFLLTSDDEARYPMFMGGSMANKVSLADELNFDETEEEEEEEEEEELEENTAIINGPAEEEDFSGSDSEEEEINENHFEEDAPGELIDDSGSDYEDGSGMLTPVPIDFLDADVQTSDNEIDKVPMIEEEEHLRAMDEKNIVIGTLQLKLRDLEEKQILREQQLKAKEDALAKLKQEADSKEKVLAETLLIVEETTKSLTVTKSTLEEKEKTLAKAEADLAARATLKSPIRSTFSESEESISIRETEANQARKRMSGASFRQPTPTKSFVAAGVQTDKVDEPEPKVIIQVKEPPPPPPKPEMKDSSVQTLAEKKPPPPPIIPQIIPRINIIPPPPTPPIVREGDGPKEFVTAETQTETKKYVSRTMQTAEIRIDHRKLGLSAAANAAAAKVAKSQVNANNTTEDVSPPQLPRRSSKRNARRTSQSSINSMQSSRISQIPETPTSPLDKTISESLSPFASAKGKERADDREKEPTIEEERQKPTPDKRRSIPPSSINSRLSSDDEFDREAELSDGGYKTALAPRPRKRTTPPTMPSLTTTNLAGPSSDGIKSAPPTNSFRKTAMISNGTQAHSRSRPRSPSLDGKSAVGPPFPVPTRFSSRKNLYGSQLRNESPTPMGMGGRPDASRRTHARRPSLRKSRSATGLVRTTRTRSPPPLSVSSAAPDSPQLPPLPQDEVFSPATDRYRFSGTWHSRHRPQASTNTSNTANTAHTGGATSVASSVQQVSVVEAITQTMVGEWMWKYVRRRKSFGVPDSPGWEASDSGAGGQRHRRWVWLAPYERAVMWSSRQPKDGAALLGKSGRKLPIQSVLDVKDDTPLPKNTAGMPREPGFNRSILILTPARALKFTAPTRERHYIWLTALSFLSHSNGGDNDSILAIPPSMPFLDAGDPGFPPPIQKQPMGMGGISRSREWNSRNPPLPRHRREDSEMSAAPPPISRDPYGGERGGGGGGGGGIRDSIRVAKGKFAVGTSSSRPSRRQPDFDLDLPPMPPPLRSTPSTFSTDSIAEGPSIPRYPGHSRKRSNTGSRLPPRSVSNGYPNSGMSAASSFTGQSFVTDPFSIPAQFQPGTGGVGLLSSNSSMSGGPLGGGWDAPGALGTVRMEAFVERGEGSEYSGRYVSRRRSGYSGRDSRRESYLGGMREGGEEWDVFRGF